MKYIIIFILVITSCTYKENKKQESVVEEEILEATQPTKLFKISNIEDTLYNFMSLCDTIPNPYSGVKINFVYLSKVKNDTIIVFSENIGLPIIFDPKSKIELKGGCKINNQNIVVYYDGIKELKDIVNEDILNIEYAYQIDLKYEGEPWESDYYPSKWKYKLTRDSLITIKKFNFSDFLNQIKR